MTDMGKQDVKQEDNQKNKIDPPWETVLSPEVYYVTRQKGTEPPFSGAYYSYHGQGQFACACCGTRLFEGAHKYDSGSGWPSFWQASSADVIEEIPDNSHGMVRTEIACKGCGAHLGHVFPDGPPPTGLRYCVNSLSLTLQDESPE